MSHVAARGELGAVVEDIPSSNTADRLPGSSQCSHVHLSLSGPSAGSVDKGGGEAYIWGEYTYILDHTYILEMVGHISGVNIRILWTLAPTRRVDRGSNAKSNSLELLFYAHGWMLLS